MNELTSLALELQSFCEFRNWRFCLIGGLAVQHWGEPRYTKDVDIWRHLTPLAEVKESPEILDRLQALLAEVRAGESS